MMTEASARTIGLPPMQATGAADTLPFSVPARHNPRLNALAERISGDEELRQLWRCANVNAVDRLGLGDCGEVHVRIVANAALKLLRLLRDSGVPGSVVEHHRLPPDEAEVVVVLAAAVHDLGLAVDAGGDPSAGLALAALKGRELLDGLYGVRERTIILAEALHAMGAQPAGRPCLTREAGVLRLADALDMTKGRVRMPTDPARERVGVVPVDEVTIQRSKQPPVRVTIRLSEAGAVGAIETVLHHRLRGAGLDDLVEVVARLEGSGGGRLYVMQAWERAPIVVAR